MNDFTLDELKVLRWAIMVSTDAVTVQASTGQIDSDDATHLLDLLGTVESKLHDILE